MPAPPRPPVLTLLQELLSWSLDRAEGFPRSHRFTLTERLLNHSLDALDLAHDAAFSPGTLQNLEAKKLALHRLNLLLEKNCGCSGGWFMSGDLFPSSSFSLSSARLMKADE